MAADAKQPPALFDPTCFETFRFTACELDASGRVTLRYALDDEVDFVEVLELPIGAGAAATGRLRTPARPGPPNTGPPVAPPSPAAGRPSRS